MNFVITPDRDYTHLSSVTDNGQFRILVYWEPEILESNSEEMQEYIRPVPAEVFGSAPGMGPQINPPQEPVFANRGGRLSVGQNNLLNKGLSRLPLNAQNDTLTQIFQSGFRPRR